jgi:superfamily II RNA helicase
VIFIFNKFNLKIKNDLYNDENLIYNLEELEREWQNERDRQDYLEHLAECKEEYYHWLLTNDDYDYRDDYEYYSHDEMDFY